MKRWTVTILFVLTSTLPSFASDNETDLQRYGVPGPPSFLSDCFWDQPRHGPGSQLCSAKGNVSFERIATHYGNSFARLGWKRQVGGDHRELVFVRMDCGRDYPHMNHQPILGRAVYVNSQHVAGRTDVYLTYFEYLPQLEGLSVLPKVSAVYCQLAGIARDTSLDRGQKEERFRVVQRSAGLEIFTSAIRLVPVWNPETNEITTYDTAVRRMTREIDPDGTAPINRDPVGAAMSLFADPSIGNITSQTGLPNPMNPSP